MSFTARKTAARTWASDRICDDEREVPAGWLITMNTDRACVDEGMLEIGVAFEQLLPQESRVLEVLEECKMHRKVRRQMSQAQRPELRHHHDCC